MRRKSRVEEKPVEKPQVVETEESQETVETTVESAEASQEVSVQSRGYFVKQGVSVTSLRGIKANGAEVSKDDFPDGDVTLNELVERGLIEAK